jgi:hypothetical protein
VAQKPLELRRCEKNIGIDPHNEIIIEFVIKWFLTFSACDICAKTHIANEVNITGLSSTEYGLNIILQAPGNKFRPALKKFARKLRTRQANNHLD